MLRRPWDVKEIPSSGGHDTDLPACHEASRNWRPQPPPKIVREAEERYQLASEFPDWTGDGIALKLAVSG